MTKGKIDKIFDSAMEKDENPDKCAAEEINPSTKNWKIKLSFEGVPETFPGDKKSIKKTTTKEDVRFLHTQAFRDLCRLHKWEDDRVITLEIKKDGDSLLVTVKHNKFDFCTLIRFEEEHLEIFNNPDYKGEFSTPENEKCPPKIDPEQFRNGGMLPKINRQPAIAETTSSIAGEIDEIYTMKTRIRPPKRGGPADLIDIPELTQPPVIIPPEEIPLFDTPRGDRIYRIYCLDFKKMVVRLEIKPESIKVKVAEEIISICLEEDLDMKLTRGRKYVTVKIFKKKDTEYGDTMNNIENALYLEEKKPRLSKK